MSPAIRQLFILLFFLVIVAVFVFAIAKYFWDYTYRYQRKRRYSRLSRYNPKTWWRRARNKPVYEVSLTTVRDFVLTLQLSLSLAETLAGALTQAAKQFGERGTFGERLTSRVRSQLQVEPEQIIEALSVDFESEHLVELSERLELAHEGGLSYAEAVNLTLDDIEEEIRIQVEKEIERAPVMLTIPMIVGVFFAALALLGFPLLRVMFTQVGSL